MERHVYCKHIKAKNLRGFVVRGVPFLRLYDAESQCTRIGVEPDKISLLYAPAQARQVAAVSEKEVLYLRSRVDEMLKKARAGLSSLATERDRIEKTDPPSIMRDATLKVLEDEIQRQIGYCNGLSDVWQLLHQRAYELWELTQLKEERT